MTTEIDILATIKRFEGVPLSIEQLSEIARAKDTEAKNAVMWLSKKNFIYRHKGVFHVSELGDEYIGRMGLYSEKPRSLKKWKEEALTGMIQERSKVTKMMVSEPSKISRAVLSTSTIEGPEGVKPDDMLIAMERTKLERMALCKELDISMEDYKKFLREGRIRTCSAGGSEHVGIFNKNGSGYWRSVCRNCRRKSRKK